MQRQAHGMWRALRSARARAWMRQGFSNFDMKSKTDGCAEYPSYNIKACMAKSCELLFPSDLINAQMLDMSLMANLAGWG